MSALQFLPGLLAALVGVFFTSWYRKTKSPIVAFTAGALFLFTVVWFWRCFSPAPEHHPFMR